VGRTEQPVSVDTTSVLDATSPTRRTVTITNYLHFGGDTIELGEDTDIEALHRRIDGVGFPS